MFNPFGPTSTTAHPPQPVPPVDPGESEAGADDDARWAEAWLNHDGNPAPVETPPDDGRRDVPPAVESAVGEESPARADKNPSEAEKALAEFRSAELDPPASPVEEDGTSEPSASAEPSSPPTPATSASSEPTGRDARLERPQPPTATEERGATYESTEEASPDPERPDMGREKPPIADWRSMIAVRDDEPAASHPLGAWGRRGQAAPEPGTANEPESARPNPWAREPSATETREEPTGPSENPWKREPAKNHGGNPWKRDTPAADRGDDTGADVSWIDDLGDPDDGLDDAPGSGFSNAAALRVVGLVVAVILTVALIGGGAVFAMNNLKTRRLEREHETACRVWSQSRSDYDQAARMARALKLDAPATPRECPKDTDAATAGAKRLDARTKRLKARVTRKLAADWKPTADRLNGLGKSRPDISKDTLDEARALAAEKPDSKTRLDSMESHARKLLTQADSEQKKADETRRREREEKEKKAAAEQAERERKEAESRAQQSTPAPTYQTPSTPSYTPSYTPTYQAPSTPAPRATTPSTPSTGGGSATPAPSGSNTFDD